MLCKLVLDTNTLVSAFFWEGNEAELLRNIEQGKAELYISQEILREIEEVIKRPKFDEVMKKASLTSEQIMEKIVSLSHLVIAPKLNINICRDERDNKILECAESAEADYIVSGDEDLISLSVVMNSSLLNKDCVLSIQSMGRQLKNFLSISRA